MAIRSLPRGRFTTADRRRAAIDLSLPLLLIIGLLVPGDDAWEEAFELALLPMLFWYFWHYGLGGRRVAAAISIPLAWVLWLGLSGGWGAPEAQAVWDHEALAALETALFFIICVTYIRAAPIPQLECAGIGLVLASYVALLSSLGRDFVATGFALDGRVYGLGLFVNPNRAAAICTLTALFAVFLAGRSRGLIRIAMIAYLPLSLLYLVHTGSRSGFIAFPLALITYVAISNGFLAIRRTAIVVAGGALLVAIIVAVTPGLLAFLEEQISRNVYRLEIWAESWRLSQERIVLGHGLGYDQDILGRFKHPHDLHLANLLYGGVPALILGLLTLAIAAAMAFRLSQAQCRALAVSCVVLVVVWTIPNGGVPISKPSDDWYHFWIPIALTVGLRLRRHAAASSSA